MLLQEQVVSADHVRLRLGKAGAIALSAFRGRAFFLRRTSQPSWYSSALPHCGQVSVWFRCSGFSSRKIASLHGSTFLSHVLRLLPLKPAQQSIVEFRRHAGRSGMAKRGRRPKKFSVTKAVKANARERVGQPRKPRGSLRINRSRSGGKRSIKTRWKSCSRRTERRLVVISPTPWPGQIQKPL